MILLPSLNLNASFFRCDTREFAISAMYAAILRRIGRKYIPVSCTVTGRHSFRSFETLDRYRVIYVGLYAYSPATWAHEHIGRVHRDQQKTNEVDSYLNKTICDKIPVSLTKLSEKCHQIMS